MDRDRARDIFRRADAVCFDVDSTVIQDEGINLLAAHKGKVEEISTITFRYLLIFGTAGTKSVTYNCLGPWKGR